MDTYKVSYRVETEKGTGYEVVQKGVIGFYVSPRVSVISFDYDLTDANRLTSESFIIDGKLISLKAELEG
jgi:hypothetical protein